MPLAEDDQLRVEQAEREAAAAGSSKLLVRDPTESQKLGPFTVICVVLNRMIGSGIYVAPAIVLRQTGSVGASLLLWTLGAVLCMSGLLVYLELGLSIPKFQPPDATTNEPAQDGAITYVVIPRNGGAKNYLEYIYLHPRIRTTCMYGVIYVILGNRTGNALMMAAYINKAAGRSDSASEVRGIAAAILTLVCIIHATWRKGGILLNNMLAVLKASILVAIIAVGFAASAGASFGHGNVEGYTIDPDTHTKTSNFQVHSAFATSSNDAAGFISSFIQILYTFSGFEQPFNILSEVYRPKKKFAKSAIPAVSMLVLLFILVNVAYLCVVPNDAAVLGQDLDMASLFFRRAFQNEVAERVMAGIIALSIFGNLFITTFTASKVKQEIAKEGILPWSDFFARSTTTPYAWIQSRFSRSSKNPKAASSSRAEEQSSAPALLLHWIFAMFLLAVTASESIGLSYRILIDLYTYTLVIMTGLAVAGGLLYLRWKPGSDWTANVGFSPWGGPTAAILFSLACAFALVGAFVPPTAGSALSYEVTGLRWYIIPTIGLASLSIGYAYYLVFAKLIPRWRRQVRVIQRDPVIVRQFGKADGEWVQLLELVEIWWESRGQPSDSDDDDHDERHGHGHGHEA